MVAFTRVVLVVIFFCCVVFFWFRHMPKRKKKRTQKKQEELDASAPNAGEDAPRAMVFKRGKVGISVTNLIANIRRMLQPNCAVNLKESKKNTLKVSSAFFVFFNLLIWRAIGER